MAGIPVTGDQYFELDGKLLEITRQLRQRSGYPFDPHQLDAALQRIIEGKFGSALAPASVPPRRAPAPATSRRAPTPVPPGPVILPLWFKVRLGAYKTPGDYAAALAAKGITISPYAAEILAKISIAAKEEDLEIFLGSARDFGFLKNTPRRMTFERAALHGYYPCPAEVGPAARLQYEDQPIGQSLALAMEPVADADHDLRVFNLVHCDTGVRLVTYDGCPDGSSSPDIVLVWCRRKP